MTLKLFDTLVTPILTSGSPVWSSTLVKESSRDCKKICDSAIPEKINVKLCKYMLGSGKYSVDDAGRGELGRYPVIVYVLSNGLKFFQSLQNHPDSTLVKSSHQDVIQWPQFFNKTPWLHKFDHGIRRSSCAFNYSATIVYPKKLCMHTVFALLCFVVVIHWLIFHIHQAYFAGTVAI